MARFFIRVELHNAVPSGPEYTKLHEAMATSGFSRVVTGVTDGNAPATWHLPNGVYQIEIDKSRRDVRDLVRQVIESIGYSPWYAGTPHQKTFELLVTEGSSSWVGLREA
jgi:hypothetical protein